MSLLEKPRSDVQDEEPKRLERDVLTLIFLVRYAMEGFFDPIPVIAGLIQTVLYTDFFYIYWTKIMQGKQFNLPV